MKTLIYLKALSDETRLRLVNLLLNNELNVNEIASVMEMGQSRVSRHLKILTDSGILSSRRDGLWVFYRAVRHGDGKEFLDSISGIITSDKELKQDLTNLESLIKSREKSKNEFFDSIALDWDKIRYNILGDLDVTSRIVSSAGEFAAVADLGCGTGELLYSLKDKAEKIIGVDRSSIMLEQAKERFSSCSTDADLRIGDLEHLPMRDREVDFAVFNMVLHHMPDPSVVIAESWRVLKESGRLIIADFDKHSNEEMRNLYGHRWLGFSSNEMEGWLNVAGFNILEETFFDIKNGLKVCLYVSEKV